MPVMLPVATKRRREPLSKDVPTAITAGNEATMQRPKPDCYLANGPPDNGADVLDLAPPAPLDPMYEQIHTALGNQQNQQRTVRRPRASRDSRIGAVSASAAARASVYHDPVLVREPAE